MDTYLQIFGIFVTKDMREYRENQLLRYLMRIYNARQSQALLFRRFVIFLPAGLLYAYLAMPLESNRLLFWMFALLPVSMIAGYLQALTCVQRLFADNLIEELRLTPLTMSETVRALFLLQKFRFSELTMFLMLAEWAAILMSMLSDQVWLDFDIIRLALIYKIIIVILIYLFFKLGAALGIESGLLGAGRGGNIEYVFEDIGVTICSGFLLLLFGPILIFCICLFPFGFAAFWIIVEFLYRRRAERISAAAELLLTTENPTPFFPYQSRTVRFKIMRDQLKARAAHRANAE